MQILSPYGKDIHQELQEVYGFSSVHAFGVARKSGQD